MCFRIEGKTSPIVNPFPESSHQMQPARIQINCTGRLFYAFKGWKWYEPVCDYYLETRAIALAKCNCGCCEWRPEQRGTPFAEAHTWTVWIWVLFLVGPLKCTCDDFVHRFGFEPSEKGVKEMKQALQAGNLSRKDFTCTLRLETPVPRYQRREYVLPVWIIVKYHITVSNLWLSPFPVTIDVVTTMIALADRNTSMLRPSTRTFAGLQTRPPWPFMELLGCSPHHGSTDCH